MRFIMFQDRTVPQRMPCQEHLYQEFKSQLQEEIEANIHAVVSRIPVPEHRLKEIREGTMSDPVLQIVMTYCKEGWPQRVLDRLKPFADVSASMATYDNILLYESQGMHVPTSL